MKRNSFFFIILSAALAACAANSGPGFEGDDESTEAESGSQELDASFVGHWRAQSGGAELWLDETGGYVFAEQVYCVTTPCPPFMDAGAWWSYKLAGKRYVKTIGLDGSGDPVTRKLVSDKGNLVWVARNLTFLRDVDIPPPCNGSDCY